MYSEKYDLPYITPHGFRHTHCSLLFEAGASIKEVQERLGHEDIKTTMNIYAHVTENTKEKTAEKFAQFWECNAQPLPFPLPFQKKTIPRHGNGLKSTFLTVL